MPMRNQSPVGYVCACMFAHKVRKVVFGQLFVLAMLLGNKSYADGKSVYFPLNGSTFVRKMHFCEYEDCIHKN